MPPTLDCTKIMEGLGRVMNQLKVLYNVKNVIRGGVGVADL